VIGEIEKAATAFRTISEVAEELQVPQHVLRFWETRFSAVRPIKRGGNRRYYRPEDLHLLKVINHLLYTEGYTIRGVQKLLREQGPRQLIAHHVAPAPGVETAKSVTADEVQQTQSEPEKSRNSFDPAPISMMPEAYAIDQAAMLTSLQAIRADIVRALD
jgi:DNA-binding transcriptional MerR regulator